MSEAALLSERGGEPRSAEKVRLLSRHHSVWTDFDARAVRIIGKRTVVEDPLKDESSPTVRGEHADSLSGDNLHVVLSGFGVASIG